MISVCITTYDSGNGIRTPIAQKTIDSLQKFLVGEITWFLNDDSTVDTHVLNFPGEILRSYGKGVGKAKNDLLNRAFQVSPFVLLLEDDWVLTEPFHLAPHEEVLNDPSVGIVRLGYLGGMMDAHYESIGFYNFWRLTRGTGVYVYSGQVSLRHKRFYDAVGYHQEGVSPGEEELEMCKRFNGTDNAPDNIWCAKYPTGLNEGPFKNIGMDYSTNGVIPT